MIEQKMNEKKRSNKNDRPKMLEKNDRTKNHRKKRSNKK